MTTATVNLLPAPVDLELYAGDDTTIRLFFSTDAPQGAKYVGTFDPARAYTAGQITLETSVFYVAVTGSIGVTPGTDATRWQAITPTDLSGYTGWKSQIRSTDTDAVSFAISTAQQAQSIIVMTIAGTVLSARLRRGAQRWDIRATGPDGKQRTFFFGKVSISEDASR